jgi:hypothetical protein
LTRGDDDEEDDDAPPSDVYVSEKRGSEFRALVRRHFERTQVESASADELLASVNATRRAEGQLIFTLAEVRLLLQMMDAEKGDYVSGRHGVQRVNAQPNATLKTMRVKFSRPQIISLFMSH